MAIQIKKKENHSTQVYAHRIFQVQLYIANAKTQTALSMFKRISSLGSGGKGMEKVIFNPFFLLTGPPATH